MRRGIGSLLAALLLLAAVASPLAFAQQSKRGQIPSLPDKLPMQPAPSAPANPRATPTQGGGGGGGGSGASALAGLMGLGFFALALLALGLLAAQRSTRVKPRKAPRKTYDAGRQRARGLKARSSAEAFHRLGEARLGEVLEASSTPAGARILVERPRGHPCDEVAGFLAGLFESVWAMDVRVEHDRCAGKAGPCRYHVTRADSPVLNVSSSRTAEAWTPEWSVARRQSPPARRGGS